MIWLLKTLLRLHIIIYIDKDIYPPLSPKGENREGGFFKIVLKKDF
jgi:hypothetical protein